MPRYGDATTVCYLYDTTGRPSAASYEEGAVGAGVPTASARFALVTDLRGGRDLRRRSLRGVREALRDVGRPEGAFAARGGQGHGNGGL